MKINPLSLSNLTQMTDLLRFLQPFVTQVGQAINGNLTFKDNINSNVVVQYFGTTMPISINHGLNTTPVGYLAIQTSKPAIIYNGSTIPITSNAAILASSLVGVTATILFF